MAARNAKTRPTRRRQISTGPIDGRHQRTERTHRRILDAVYKLMAQSARPMSVPQVARAAGVSVRTVFLHFPDFESLWHEATDAVRERFDRMVTPIPPTGSLRQRLDATVVARAKLFERQASYRRAGSMMMPHSAAMRARRAQHRQLYRQRLAETFAPELAALSASRRREGFEALAAVADWDFWESLRLGQGLSAARAKRVWRLALGAVLASLAPSAD